jgi:tRNA (Thr-GGU) A37 N-methylase
VCSHKRKSFEVSAASGALVRPASASREAFCKLLFVQGLEIRVSQLDALDDTPVLDVKPYLKDFAPRGEVREPAWANELMAGYFCKD